jgi:hypothetical protein
MSTRDEFSHFLYKKIRVSNYRFSEGLCKIINNTYSKDELLDCLNNLKSSTAIQYCNELIEYIMLYFGYSCNININDEFLLMDILETFEKEVKQLKDNSFNCDEVDHNDEELTFKTKYLSTPKVTISDYDEE